MAKLIADWQFCYKGISNTDLTQTDLVVKDLSENGNDLKMNIWGDGSLQDEKNSLKWVHYGDKQALKFENCKKTGSAKYFSTVENAPLNSMNFENGYTIEVELKLPPDLKFDPWMGIVTRQGNGKQIGKTEGETEILATLSFQDSFQFTWYPMNENKNYTCWSCCADDLLLSDFIHISVRNDGKYTKMYLNGVCDIRNPSALQNGIEFVSGMGWNVGASVWNNELDSFFSGELKRIRIFDGDAGKTDTVLNYQQRLFTLSGTNEPQALRQSPENNLLAVLPDSQYMGQYKHEIVDEMVKWVTDYRESLGISAMIHVGDLSEEANINEFKIADLAFQYADNVNFDYMVTPGNHDDRDGCINFEKYFGANRYKHKNNIQFASNSLSSALTVTLSNRDYLLLSLDSYKIEQALPWAKQVVKERNMPTILFTHDIYDIAKGKLFRSENGERIWKELINDCNEIFLTIGGHFFGVGHQIEKNASGKEVVELLVNYQAYPNGGNGWLQLLEFDETKNQILVQTYSPWVELQKEKDCYDFAYLTSPMDQFQIPLCFKERLKD